MRAFPILSRISAAVAFCAAAAGASAEPLALNYSATWGGGRAAEIRLLLDENGATFRNQLDIETVGLAWFLSGFKARAISAGEAEGEGEVAPRAFDAVYDSRRRRDKRIDLQFVELEGSSIAEDGPNDSSKDPALPEELRRDVIDPLSSITAIRRMVRESSIDAAKGFKLAVYDGKRRFDVDGTVISTEILEWGGGRVPVINLRLVLRPVAGFDDDGDDGYRPDGKTREIVVALTNDARAIPLRMAVQIAYVPALVVLDHKTKL